MTGQKFLCHCHNLVSDWKYQFSPSFIPPIDQRLFTSKSFAGLPHLLFDTPALQVISQGNRSLPYISYDDSQSIAYVAVFDYQNIHRILEIV